MYNPAYGYDPRTWQGFQPGQVYPQHNVQYQQPNHGPVPLMNINQRYPPNSNIGWGHPPMNPMMQHPVQFPANFPNQPAPPGTDNAMGGIFNDYEQPTPGHNANPFHSQESANNYPFTGPVQNPHPLSTRQMNRIQPVPGQATYTHPVPGQMNHTQPVPGQMNHTQPVPGQMNHAQPVPGQLNYTQPVPEQVNHNHLYPGQIKNTPHLPQNSLLLSGQGSFAHLVPKQVPISHPVSGNFNGAANAPPVPGKMPNPPLPPGPAPPNNKPPLPGQTSSTQPPLPGNLDMQPASGSKNLDGPYMDTSNVAKNLIEVQISSETSSNEANDWARSEKVPIRCGSKDLNVDRRSKCTSTHHTPNKVSQPNHSSKSDHNSRSKQKDDSSRKRKTHQSPNTPRHATKKSRNDSESSRSKQDDTRKSYGSSDRENNTSRSRNDVRTSHKDRNTSRCSDKNDTCSSSKNNVDRQRKDSSKTGETKRRDLPLRCVSPPPPDINRRIKFIVPEDYYKLTKDGSSSKTFTTATKKLEKVYERFDKEVLNPSSIAQDTSDKDISGLDETVKQKQMDLTDRIEDDTFDLDSLDGSVFDANENRSKGEYSADSFAANDDSDDSDDDKNDADVSDSSSDDECGRTSEMNVKEIRQRKLTDPRRLHPDMWFNEKGEGNDGPVCKCCAKDKEHGIRHGVYPGEKDVPLCNPVSNNARKLYHYWVTITPHCNFMTERPTVIRHNDKDYVFEGFSLISHESLDWIPTCSFIRFNIEYKIHLVREPLPKNFCIKGLELFSKFLFHDILDLCDWTLKGQSKEGCPIFHFLPRFIHRQKDKKDGKEIHQLLSIDKVLYHLLKNTSKQLIKPDHLEMPRQNERPFARAHYNNIVTKPNKKPAAFRIDDILFDSENEHDGKKAYPLVLHHGIRPVQMSYAGNPRYQKLWKSYLRLRSAIANKAVTSRKDHDKLVKIKVELEEMKVKSSMRRDVEVRTNSKGLIKTGINSDVCQHAMILPVIVHHLRYHMSLKTLDDKLGYKFKDRTLLQLALTHPSYHLNFGTNPDQARNTLTNCGVKLPRYGDRKIHRMNTKKKGITQLIRIMANLGKLEENQSMIRHNERLEFLGDAVLEFICSSHLFFMLPENSEGDLAMFRSGLVQNTHLAVLAKTFNLCDYMQYSHGPDLCKEEDLDHAMANCFEAIMGAIFLEGGLQAATDFFTKMAFREEKLRKVWVNTPKHPLQIQEDSGDRHLISSSPVLQKLQKFENSTGIIFTHIRLLARAFTHPQVGFNNLTLGDNQRMEFLGDSVLQFIVSIYLFRHFPDHHEGHLTLLRSSLVNNRIQADVSRQLGMDKYINFGSKEVKNIREKLLADVLEAFLAALYIDKGLQYVEVFCRECFFSRVEESIVNQEWIDSKSQLQQCCLALREEGKQPDLPVYKVLQDSGPSHDKKFQVAVYYKRKRVGTGEGHSMHMAEMAAAKDALASSYFPEMARQKHFLDGKYQDKRTRRYEPPKHNEKSSPLAVETMTTPKEPAWVEHE